MKFCSYCGAEVIIRTPDNDDRERFVCISCETIHYQNPKIITGCIPVWNNEILLCKRAIEPRAGYWTLPAGFMELGETTVEAALRETWEEANARVDILNLYVVINLPMSTRSICCFDRGCWIWSTVRAARVPMWIYSLKIRSHGMTWRSAVSGRA